MKRPGGLLSFLVLAALVLAACGAADVDVALTRAPAPTTTAATTTTAAPAPPDTEAPAPTTATPTTAPAEPKERAAPVAPPPPVPSTSVAAVMAPPTTFPGRFTIEPYRGLGTWVDVFDWTHDFTGGNPVVGPEHMAEMAAAGVQTLYIQASRWDRPTEVMERDRLMAMIDAAHANGMAVVGWYLPALVDPADDLRKMIAVASLPIEGLGVDIEARNVKDHAERNRRLVQLSTELRAALPNEVISGIVLPPVVTDIINPNYWPGFPWAEIAPLYDLWQPMSYWTNRSQGSGYRDGYRYTAENIDLLRQHLGDPDALVHTIGGIGDETTVEDIDGMLRAAQERGAIGGSIYDWRTTGGHLWPPQQPFRTG